ncbi:hypothetical protein WKH82_17395 [Acinetobacter baumannii]|nr:hypothetical protein [Acinetobacter baumannii]
MNTEILKKLSTKKLNELKAAIEAEISNRYDFSVLPGRTGRFISSNDGKERHVEIMRINTKTISVKELYDSVNPGGQWKIPKSMIKMDGIERDTHTLAKLHRADKPKDARPSADYGVASW